MTTYTKHSSKLVQSSSTTIHGVTLGFDPEMVQPYYVRVDFGEIKWFWAYQTALEYSNRCLAAKVLDKLFSCLTLTPDEPQPLTIDNPLAVRYLESCQAWFEYMSLIDNDGDPDRACTVTRSQSCELKRRERLALQDGNSYMIATHSKHPGLTIPALKAPEPQTALPNLDGDYTPGRIILMQGDTYVTTGKAAEMLGIKPDSVRALIRRGKLDAVKFGRDYFISIKAVQAYKASYRKPGPKPGSKK